MPKLRTKTNKKSEWCVFRFRPESKYEDSEIYDTTEEAEDEEEQRKQRQGDAPDRNINRRIINQWEERDLEMEKVKNELSQLRKELQQTKEVVRQLLEENGRINNQMDKLLEEQQTNRMGHGETRETTEVRMEEGPIKTNADKRIPSSIKEDNRREPLERMEAEKKSWIEESRKNRQMMVHKLQEFQNLRGEKAEEEARKGGYDRRTETTKIKTTPVPLYVSLPRQPYRIIKDLLFRQLKVLPKKDPGYVLGQQVRAGNTYGWKNEN